METEITNKITYEKEEDTEEEDEILKELGKVNVCDTFVQLREKEICKITHNTFVLLCLITMFFALIFLSNNRLMCSFLIVMSVTLLHFKNNVLLKIYKQMGLCKKKMNK